MADIFGFQDMDLDGLDFDDVNLLDSLSSPPPADNLLFSPLPPLLPHEQQPQPQPPQPQPQLGGRVESSLIHTAAPPFPPNNPDVELAEAVTGAQINGTTAAPDTLASITATNLPLGPTPDVTASSLIRPPTLFPALEEWFARGLSTSAGVPPNHSAVVLSSQHENMNMPQGMDVDKRQETNNEMTLTKNMAAHHASPAIISQQYHPSQPPSIQRSPLATETGVGITGAGDQAQLLSAKQPLTGWNSRWSRYVKSPPRNAHDLRSAPISLPYHTPAIHRPQQLHPLTPQGSHAPSTQHTSDLLNSTQPPYPSFSRTESSSVYQSPAAPVLPNASAHQPAVPRLLSPEPAAVPIRGRRPSILSSNYHPQPVGDSFGMTTFISFGAGPAVPQRYPDIRDYQRNFLQSQQMKSHGGIAHHQASALTPLPPSPLVSDNSNEHSQPWSRPSVQGGSPFHGPPILPKIPVSNIPSTISQPISIAPDESNPSTSLPGSNTPELSTPPWIPNSYCNQLQSVVPASTDMLTANANSESFVIPSSLTRPQATNRVRRILNLGTAPPPPPPPKSSRPKAASTSRKKAGTNDAEQLQIPDLRDPAKGWIKDLEWALNKNWNRLQPTKKKAASRSACGRREKEESSASKRRKSNAAEKEKEKEEARPIPDEAPKTHEYQVNVVQPRSASEFQKRREVDNSAYDMHCQNVGVPMDPHIRFYIAAVGRNGG